MAAVGWRCAVAVLGRRTLCSGGAAATAAPQGLRRNESVRSVQDLADLLANETGRSRVGNAHLISAVDNANADDIDTLKDQLALFVSRNKEVKEGVADAIVRRCVEEGAVATAAELVVDKLRFGLFPSSEVYVELMRATATNELPDQAISVFERMVLDVGPSVASAECLEMLSQAAESGAGPDTAPSTEADSGLNPQSAAVYCLAAREDGVAVSDEALQAVARGCVAAGLADTAATIVASAPAGSITQQGWAEPAVGALGVKVVQAIAANDPPAALAALNAMPAVSPDWGTIVPPTVLSAVEEWLAAGAEAEDDNAEEDSDADVTVTAPAPELAELEAILESLRASGVSWDEEAPTDDGATE